MKRIGKGDYVWSVKRDDLPGMAERMTAQVIGYLNDENAMMAAGIAKLAARCGLDYLHTEEREQIPLPTDYHLNENGKPACGRNDESRKYRTTDSSRITCPACRHRITSETAWEG